MSRYIPTPAYPDMMPVDISFVFENEKPAGKHGFMRVDGENLRFEDGTLGKFWGVVLDGTSCFPDKDYAPVLARRLAMVGCNVVRLHQMDGQFHARNLFAFTKGKRVDNTRVFDPRSLDALDYLVYCLKEEGIYCYLDHLVYRHFKQGDGIEQAELLGDAAKPWCLTNPRLIELQKEYATNLWNHYNPYTKLCYKDDPVFILTDLVNEADLFYNSAKNAAGYIEPTYYTNEFRQMFGKWLQEKGIEFDWQNCDLYSQDEILLEFKYEATKKYYAEMTEHLRSLGVKVPITGTTWSRDYTGATKANEDMDFADSHHYYYDWKWGNTERVCKNFSITASKFAFPRLPLIRTPNKPFFVSEWGMPWPNSYRAEGAIYYAAVGALQGWSGFTVHTYAYGNRLATNSVLGREGSSPIGGVSFREGIFSVWNDPAVFGLFYHAALITRRQDITPAEKAVAVHADGHKQLSVKAYEGILEQHRGYTVIGDAEGYDDVVEHNEAYPMPSDKVVSDNGQMWRDFKREIGGIDTPRTKIAYGYIGRGRGAAHSTHKRLVDGIVFDGMSINSFTDFGVIAVSSLTDDPIEKSNNILISSIGRARNTDAIFDGEKMLDVGKPPIMSEVIEADISIRTELGKTLKVWGITPEGYYAGKLPTTYEDGVLTFHVGDANNPASYYLVVEE